MGGGDLNSKKSWHPNTMKNQESVRKAEQMVIHEKKRIKELQQQYNEERDREELNKKIKNNSATDNRLHWMYEKPDKTVQQEDYLLGKVIDKNSETNKVDEEVIPAVARRVVGSSMLTSTDDTQVDLARKIREDPLLLVKERERAARATLLNNPLHRRKLAELLRKEQVQNKESKPKKKSKKKDKDLDNMLATKLIAISGNKGIDLKSLLESDDSSESSDEDNKKKKKKHKKKKQKHKQKKKSKHSTDSEEESDDKIQKHKPQDNSRHKNLKQEKEYRKRKSEVSNTECESKEKILKPNRKNSTERYNSEYQKRESRDDRSRKDLYRGYGGRGKGVNEQEKAARLAEMAAAGAEREKERGRRVEQERRRDEAAQSIAPTRSSFKEARSLPDTLETRIRSNRQYIQRDRRHMNEHFARR